ncbi:MAG: DUF1338 domain-containing protein [Planctomycetaceae bacterium]|nr:DUF1338 domain-containing protein [Planctomycetaceae bacterium]MCB9939614.1 DUF1338 domain-containing protein [Planctomycetaceae bacterium]
MDTNLGTTGLRGPHQAIEARTARERFALELFDRLWDRYRRRVAYVATYERIVQDAGARFFNDHIAFRTFANQRPATGISSLSRVFEALDYRPAGVYDFPDKHLNAIHYQHPHPEFPKLFISELKSWELSDATRGIIEHVVKSHRPAVSSETLRSLATLDEKSSDPSSLLDELVAQVESLPWELPTREAVETLNRESQYAAWVLVHGYNVNHFTSLVNSHGVDSLRSLEQTIDALAAAGVPMKAEIEGEPGSKLRQSATEAVKIDVEITDQGQASTMPWTYAYFELAERNRVVDPDTGETVRFEGFLGPQATNLFEMTRVVAK